MDIESKKIKTNNQTQTQRKQQDWNKSKRRDRRHRGRGSLTSSEVIHEVVYKVPLLWRHQKNMWVRRQHNSWGEGRGAWGARGKGVEYQIKIRYMRGNKGWGARPPASTAGPLKQQEWDVGRKVLAGLLSGSSLLDEDLAKTLSVFMPYPIEPLVWGGSRERRVVLEYLGILQEARDLVAEFAYARRG